MRPQLANLIHPFFRNALQLHKQWIEGAEPNFELGRSVLQSEFEELLRRFPQRVSPTRSNPNQIFLGIAYPLACWVDELFTLDSRWAREWNERKFESEYYGSNDRAWRFWEQARLAAESTPSDELEIFFLCVAQGFRGEWVDNPDLLNTWTAATWDRLKVELSQKWVGPTQLATLGPALPRTAESGLMRMMVIATGVTIIAIPLIAVLISRHLSS
jgi:type VI secretion system protein ImpK